MPTVTIMAIFHRKQGLTHEAFRAYYEANHVPLVRELLPRFDGYRRYYVSDAGMRELVGHDVVTLASFDSFEAFEAVQHAMGRPEIADRIAADEARFIDRDKTLTFAVEALESL